MPASVSALVRAMSLSVLHSGSCTAPAVYLPAESFWVRNIARAASMDSLQ
jgi:hypothetical protein